MMVVSHGIVEHGVTGDHRFPLDIRGLLVEPDFQGVEIL